MYQLLPFITACSATLPTLPIEIWCLILRLLDPKSLLTTVRTIALLNSIAQGDPVLRKTVKDATRAEQQELLERLTKPGMAARVSREEYSRLFGANAQKKIHITKCPELFEATRIVKPKKKTTSGCKSRSTVTKSSRFNPYRV